MIRVVHDECTFYANSDQSFFWGDGHTNVLRQKSLGASIIVSDFTAEVSGFVRDDEGEDRLLLETQRESYFTNEHLLQQVAKTNDIIDRVHPDPTGNFPTPSHCKDADRMNVGPGGKQPKMQDTVWGGQVQKLVDEEGVPKGMKIDRGVDTTGTKIKDMRELLKTFPDFKDKQLVLANHAFSSHYYCPNAHRNADMQHSRLTPAF